MNKWITTRDNRLVEVHGECEDVYIGREIIESEPTLKYGRITEVKKEDIIEDEED